MLFEVRYNVASIVQAKKENTKTFKVFVFLSRFNWSRAHARPWWSWGPDSSMHEGNAGTLARSHQRFSMNTSIPTWPTPTRRKRSKRSSPESVASLYLRYSFCCHSSALMIFSFLQTGGIQITDMSGIQIMNGVSYLDVTDGQKKQLYFTEGIWITEIMGMFLVFRWVYYSDNLSLLIYP